LKGPEEGTTEASDFAQAWLSKLMEYMEIEGDVVATGSDERVHICVSAKERAGRLIGRRGATLASIRQILALALEKHGDLTIDVDVEDNRSDGGEKREDRNDNRRDRDGGNRNQERGPRYSDEKLQALAKRAAEKAVETERAVTINLDLNSYGRRIVHLTIAEIEGVSTVSEERDGRKVVQVVPD
jgi:predicted RNA-binding protein Jag